MQINPNQIDIIYLTRNRSERSRKNLNLLLNSETPSNFVFKVHVVDNGSTDDTPTWLSKLDHPNLGSLRRNEQNLGIAPVVNEFWKTSPAMFIGKIDDDISVPPTWIIEVMNRLTHAEKDKIGPVTLWHWIQEWINDINQLPVTSIPLFKTTGGHYIAKSSHTGGNYIMHRYLIDKYGQQGVPTTQGLKGGFTDWQTQKIPKDIIKGYIWPMSSSTSFCQDAFEEQWQRVKTNVASDLVKKDMEHERRESQRLLTLKLPH